MKVIRHGLFETNSSSTHSISISDKAGVLDILPVEAGVCKVYPGEFGWEEDTYHGAVIKASYCLTHAKSRPEYGLGDGERELQMLEEVIKENTGAEKVEFVPNDDGFHPWGYIDHQSIECDGGAGEPAFASKESLKSFIFNPDSWLKIDNDNH